MLISAHIKKAHRLKTSRTRLDPSEDYELWYFSGLASCVNMMNAALHSLGVTKAENCFAHNVPVYFCPVGDTNTFEPEIRKFGDIEHVDSPEIEAMIPAVLGEAKQALIWLEKIRDPSIRGSITITPELIERVDLECSTCLRIAHKITAHAEEYSS